MRYRSAEEDSERWDDFVFRQDDIVISTRSKSGTTWVQMICALLIFQTPDLPAPLGDLSPWLDSLMTPKAQAYARLEAQQHRRFIKTHTPLDGIPIDQRATYIVVGRHPLDMAVSLYHQGSNLNRERIHQLTGQPPPGPPKPRMPLREWLLDWVDSDAAPQDEMDSLRGVMWHLSDAWRRRDQTNVVLIHYDDLLHDLAGEMHKLAERLGIDVAEHRWPALEEAATFTHMRSQAHVLIPDSPDIFRDPSAFFRKGASGAGRELLTDSELVHYRDRVALMAPKGMLTWLHHDQPGSGPR